ncbi:MAG: hypothetical protein HFI50_09590 [Lachnospiraceae bacterium]|nr:hypothetical protein [Lachnospiraceae bacterium]
MQHFLIEVETKDPLPEIINWYDKIKPQYVNEMNAHKIKEWLLLDVNMNQDTIFPDIFCDPFFLLSKDIAKLVNKYEPGIRMVGVNIFSKKYRIFLPYFLPILPIINCLSNQSEFIHEDIDISRGVIIERETTGRGIFQLAGIETQRVVIRLDLLESILRREPISIRVQEIEVV